MINEKVQIRIKITLMGDMGVGKTSLRRRYLSDEFLEGYIGTIGVETASKDIIVQGKKINVQLWDLAGHHQFSSVRTVFYQGSMGVVLVYDVMDRKSYENCMFWIEEMLKSTPGEIIPILLIGNKIDLRNAVIEADMSTDYVNTAEGLQLQELLTEKLRKYHHTDVLVQFHETSAMTGEGVLEAFTTFIEDIIPEFLIQE